MPAVPTFENTVAVPRSPGPPTVGLDQFAAPGQALEQAGGAVSEEGNRWLQQYAQARQQANASNLIASGMQQLGDSRFKWSHTDDSQAAYAGYQQDAAGIIKNTLAQTQDPEVQSYVQRTLTTQSAIDAQNTRGAAFQLESSKYRGQLDTWLASYAQQAAQAPDDLTRAHYFDIGSSLIDGTATGKWITPQEAADMKISFRSQIAEVKARTDLANDPVTAAHILQSPDLTAQRYPGLLPEKAASMAGEAVWRAMRVEQRAAAAQAHADAMATQQFHLMQQQNETDTLAAIYDGKNVDIGAVTDAARRGLISPGGLNTIHTAMVQQQSGTDDPHTVLDLYTALGNQQLTPTEVHAAVAAHLVKGATATELLRGINEQSKQQTSALDRQNYSTMLTAIGEGADGQSLFSFSKDADRAANTALRTEAKQEWTQRVLVNHENSSTVLADMLAHYQPAAQAGASLPRPLLGAATDLPSLNAVAVKTFQAFQGGQLDQATYDREVADLTRLRAILSQQALVQQFQSQSGGKSPATRSQP